MRITDRDDCALGIYMKDEGEYKVSISYQEGSTWRSYEDEDWAYAGVPRCSPLHQQEDDNNNEDEDEDKDNVYSYLF